MAAGRGRAALRIAEERRGGIDVGVTDVVMQEMSGPEMVAQITRSRPGLIVLYISGYSDHALLH
jgi:DNA-binding NtrC family response regulator